MRDRNPQPSNGWPHAIYHCGGHGTTQEMILWVWEHHPQTRGNLRGLVARVQARSLELQGFGLEGLTALDFVSLAERGNVPSPLAIFAMANSLRKAAESRAALVAPQEPAGRGEISAVPSPAPVRRVAQDPCPVCQR